MPSATSIHTCRQRPEEEITDFIEKMNGYYSQLKDMKAEVPNEDKRVMLCSQMHVRFKELAKAFTTCTPDITY